MYKNQLQELAQRSCFNLPSYSCIREGPDHAPRFKSNVNFNSEIYESPGFFTTLRQAEHAAAEVALNELSKRGPSKSLASKVLDETGIYKNLLQETAHRAGLKLPVYETVRSGPNHTPVYTCTVELGGFSFNGDPAKTKKQAQKNAAMVAWSELKKLPAVGPTSQTDEEQEQVTVARALLNLHQSSSAQCHPPPRQPETPHGNRCGTSVPRRAQIRARPLPNYPFYPCYGSVYMNPLTWQQSADVAFLHPHSPVLPSTYNQLERENRSFYSGVLHTRGLSPPVPVRTGGLPVPGYMGLGPVRCMAQPVQVRPVGLVCSAPPASETEGLESEFCSRLKM